MNTTIASLPPLINHFYHRTLLSLKRKTLNPFLTFHSTNSFLDIDHLLNLLRLSVKYTDIDLIRAIHASIFKLEEDTYLGNAVIVAYLKVGLVPDAYEVFKGLSCPDVVSYTVLISSFAKVSREKEAIKLFFEMRSSGIEPNEYSFVAILTASLRIFALELGMQGHALAIKMGFLEYVFVGNALMGLYGKSRCLDYVIQLFDEMPQRKCCANNNNEVYLF